MISVANSKPMFIPPDDTCGLIAFQKDRGDCCSMYQNTCSHIAHAVCGNVYKAWAVGKHILKKKNYILKMLSSSFFMVIKI